MKHSPVQCEVRWQSPDWLLVPLPTSLPSRERPFFVRFFRPPPPLLPPPPPSFTPGVFNGRTSTRTCFIQRDTAAWDGAESGHGFCRSIIIYWQQRLPLSRSETKQKTNIRTNENPSQGELNWRPVHLREKKKARFQGKFSYFPRCCFS